MPFEAPFESFDITYEVGSQVFADAAEIGGILSDQIDDAILEMATVVVDELGAGRTPKRPWPILTGRSKGIGQFATGGRGGFYVDDASGEGFEIWNRTNYAQWVELGIAGRHRRRDGGRFIAKLFNRNEERYFDIARDHFASL